MKKEQKRKNRNEVGIIKKIKQVDKDLNNEKDKNRNEKYHNINAKGVFKRLNSIRSKLIFAFLVPVIFIIVLGVVSYTKSSKGLTQSYESSSLSTLSYMTKYLDFCLGTVSQDVDNISDNEVLVNYYSGVYKNDPNEETKRFQEMKSTISSQIYSLTYINNMYVFSNYGKGFSGNNLDTSKLNMDSFTAKGEGALPKKNGVDGMWVGKHPYLDELSGTDASGYALSYIRNVYDIFENPISCIVVNISYKYIMSTIAESGLPKGGAIAFI
ncbi:MAG TPA: hypothetical protein VN131_03320, partial [Mobilitalea sp.]|nr:hypothetical protein [Mobilitalea sp.]